MFNREHYSNPQKGFLNVIAISLILVPYFVNTLHLSDSDSYSGIKQWV
jgi:hypothetical protein